MPLTTMADILYTAEKKSFALAGFNVNMRCQAKSLIEIHEILNSPLIIQCADLANAFMGGRADFLKGSIDDKRLGISRIAAAVKEYGGNSHIPIALHLDHGRDFESVKAAVDGGFTSVMIDGSSLGYNENIELTRAVVDYAHPRGVSVEGELGVLAGIEDDVFSENSTYTNPTKVVDFCRKTKVDCLAISYGTKHGAVKGDSIKLRKEIVIACRENLRHENINCALVSHGSSTVPKRITDAINRFGGDLKNANGIPMNQIVEVINCGISKINIDTDIRMIVTRNIRAYFSENLDKKRTGQLAPVWSLLEESPSEIDPRVYLAPVMDLLIAEQSYYSSEIQDLTELISKGVKEIAAILTVGFGSAGTVEF